MLNRKKPEFNERMFEFAYNAEFCRTHKAILASAPILPSTNMERLLAYDVSFRIKKGAAVKSVFLQHKVATKYWVPVGQTTKSHYSRILGPSYFRFDLDNRQYNRIIHLGTKRGWPLYYCAPKFATERAINRNFLSGNIDSKSIWIDVKNAGKLVGADFKKSHCIGYTANEKNVLRFSEEPVGLATCSSEMRLSELPVVRLDKHYLNSLIVDMRSVLDAGIEKHLDASTHKQSQFENLIAAVATTASKKFGLTWLLIPE